MHWVGLLLGAAIVGALIGLMTGSWPVGIGAAFIWAVFASPQNFGLAAPGKRGGRIL